MSKLKTPTAGAVQRHGDHGLRDARQLPHDEAHAERAQVAVEVDGALVVVGAGGRGEVATYGDSTFTN